jgi:Protein of unknown function (DUF3024)
MPYVPEPGLQRIRDFCAEKIPGAMQSEVRIECSVRGDAVTIVERRAPWSPEIPEWSSSKVARLRYSGGEWVLDSADGSGRWHEFGPHPTGTLDELLAEIDKDSTGIFWG